MTPTSLRSRILVLAVAAGALVAGALPGQNLVSNGDFHDSVAGWTLAVGQQMAWTGDYDESDCAASGVAAIVSGPVSDGHRAEIVRCLVLPATGKLSLLLRFATEGKLVYGIDLHATTNCTSALVGGGFGELFPDDLQWKTGSVSIVVPPEARSASIFASSWLPGEHVIGVDAFVLSIDEPIFLDGFEGDPAGTTSPCRWCTNCS